eukprot:10483114-Alexandrium_andersonii.AAC.1
MAICQNRHHRMAISIFPCRPLALRSKAAGEPRPRGLSGGGGATAPPNPPTGASGASGLRK